MTESGKREGQRDSGLVRPATLRRLRVTGVLLLVLIVVAGTLHGTPARFPVGDWLGFGALFGAASGLALLLIARLLGAVIGRDASYYDDEHSNDA
ncbi:MAG: hypothetical protein AAGD86_08315 [Pseudomonadota bacterium]